MMEILSYLNNWKEVIEKTAKKSQYLFVSLYLPLNPIGFVKSFSELKAELNKCFNMESELLWNNETIFILAKSKNAT